MRSRTLIIVVGAIVAILGLAGIALLVSGGDDANSGGVLAPGETVRPTYGPDVQETRSVEVKGDPLPPFDSAVEVDPAIGKPMPIVTGSTFDGLPMTIGGPTDGPTLYAFFAHWCPHCNDEIPNLIELQARAGIPAGMSVVGISTGVDSSAPNYPPSKWTVNKDWPWPMMADDAQSTSFVVNGGSGFPYLMLVDKSGNVLARESGEHSAEDTAKWIKQALADAPAA